MKRSIIIFMMAIGFTTNVYSQDSIQATSVVRQKYLKKSDNQRAVSLVMLGIGVTTAAIIFPKTNSLENAVNAIGLSMATGITGIILYLASIRNRKKFKSFSAGFRIEKQANPLGKNYESSISTVSVRFAF